jgi:hypothetical protein
MRILRILAVAGTTGLVAMSGGLASPATSQPSSEALQAARNLVALVSPATITQMASDVTAKVWPRIEAAMRSNLRTLALDRAASGTSVVCRRVSGAAVPRSGALGTSAAEPGEPAGGTGREEVE